MSELHPNMEDSDISDNECSKDFVDPFPNCRLSELVARMLGEDYIDMEKEEEQSEDTNDPFENAHDVQTAAFISYLGDFKYLFREPLPSIEESEFEDDFAGETEVPSYTHIQNTTDNMIGQTKDLERTEYTNQVVGTSKSNVPIENISTVESDVEVQTQTTPISFDFDLDDNNHAVQTDMLQTFEEETLSVEVDTDDSNITFHNVSMDDLNEESVNQNVNQQYADNRQACKFSWSVTSV